jgi:hypothetical protein
VLAPAKATPEPSTIIIWSLLSAIGVLGYTWCRRRTCPIACNPNLHH